jgi:hypothetical protein
MPFQKGNKHGKGRPQKPEIEQLRLAIEKVQKEHDRTLMEEFVHKAYEDNTVMVALMRKLVADKRALEASVSGELGVIFRFSGNGSGRKKRN